MDTQLIQDFKNLYFSKKQISRRIFDKEELEEIWKMVEEDRIKMSMESRSNFEPLVNYWFNNTEDIICNTEFIDEANNLGVFNYISQKIREKLNNSAEELELLGLDNLDSIVISDEILKNLKLAINNDCKIDEEFILNLYSIIDGKGKKDDKNNIQGISRDELNADNIKTLISLINENGEKSALIVAATIYLYIIVNKPFRRYNSIISELLSYKYLLINGYEVIKYCSLSTLINSKLKKYKAAIENSIYSNGDITYFIRFYISALREAVEALNNELNYKFGKRILKELIERNNVRLEERHIKFINSILSSKDNVVTIDNYKNKLDISYETARSDLNYLVTLGFFKIAKSGKRYEYYKNDISTIVDNFEE
ncbi:Fic family protein [Clostridium tertium]|uniref:Fic family protein n=1 Tax=Clostridium tertium TaxID=1559 RepID=UPI0024B3B0AE|nr:Fic family protein [Clostridium tertium]MDI9217772.1 Fic family protein [Clostridium tertium]